MNKGAILANTVRIEMETSPLVYTGISSLKSISISAEKSDFDLYTMDSEGWDEHIPIKRGATISGEGNLDEDPDTREKDPGQLALIQASYETGMIAIKNFRMVYKKTGAVLSTFKASVNVNDNGSGGAEEVRKFAFELKVSGPYSTSIITTGILVSPQVINLSIGELSSLITATFTPIYASNKTLSFATDDATVAQVVNGVVVGVGIGTATITVTAEDGSGEFDTVDVTVS